MTERPKLSNLIRELRKRLGLLVCQLSVSFQTFDRWENFGLPPHGWELGIKLIESLLVEMAVRSQDLWQQYFSEQHPDT
ncbi:MAG: transcriptional regulator [Fischerella sp.]|nr:transcriptional regulator [Fischerella sp.]